MMNNIKKSGIGMLLVGIFLMIISVLLIEKMQISYSMEKLSILTRYLKTAAKYHKAALLPIPAISLWAHTVKSRNYLSLSP